MFSEDPNRHFESSQAARSKAIASAEWITDSHRYFKWLGVLEEVARSGGNSPGCAARTTMSAAARAKISKATNRHWARYRAEKVKRSK
jgi:hypothetical protein